MDLSVDAEEAMENLVEDAEEEKAEDVEVEGKKTKTIHSRILSFFFDTNLIILYHYNHRRGGCGGHNGGGCGGNDGGGCGGHDGGRGGECGGGRAESLQNCDICQPP